MNRIGSKIDEVRIDGCMDKFQTDLEEIKKMGIHAIELPVHGLDAIINGKLHQRRVQEILGILKEFDFQYSVHAPNPLNLMDKENPDLHSDVLLASLEFAQQAGATVVVVHPGRFIPEEWFGLSSVPSISQKQKNDLLEQEALLLQTIADQYPDIIIAMENARPYLNQSPYTYAEFIPDLKHQVLCINKENVKINLDLGHLYMTSTFYNYDPVKAVSNIKDLIAHTHIHDNFGGVVNHYEKQQTHQLPFGKGDSHMPVGWGKIPIARIMEIILPVYKGLLMMELRSRYFNHIKESAENLSAMLEHI
ncbi:sugar phosphate isomerase/epimerase family protein [Desulfobacula phenolica]|uniref:Sugar phosphate isomerase/epimerase n=1 Tax=Desulfobacula phenolica TaxID=90732 RepID=A0A1H2H2P3_9BACT|nr:sugar phosphate isomerase/epimerase [Desulfobacula phenolica]SDU26140.1 Sugar phosphate isomerase/epimerase [Desulfobacula phenolica]